MARKKKEETQEEKPEVKKETKFNPFGWRAVVNKAKFTKAK